MNDDVFSGPTAGELIDAVVESLTTLLADVPPGRAFELRAAINTLQIVGRQLDHGAAVADAHRAMLAEFGCADDAELSRRVRAGETTVDGDLVAALLEDARRRLTVDSPRYAGECGPTGPDPSGRPS